MGATDWLNVPGKKGRQSAQSVEEALRDSAVAPNDPTIESNAPISTQETTPIPPVTLTPRDNIRLRSWASVAIKLRIAIRCQMANGAIKTIVATQNTGTTRVKNALTFSLPDGVLEILSASVSTQNSGCVRGQCYVSMVVLTSGPQVEEAGTHNITIQHGESIVVKSLLQGYLVSGCTLQLGFFEDSLSGRGFITTQTVALVITGLNQWIVPNGAVWKFYSIFGEMRTSAAAGGRFPRIDIIVVGVGSKYEASSAWGIAPSTVVNGFCFGGDAYSPTLEDPLSIPVPPNTLLNETDIIQVTIVQADAGDTPVATNLILTYEEWIQTDES